KIDFVNVQEPAVCARKQTRFEGLSALYERLLDIERSAHSIFGRAKRQIDHRHRRLLSRQTNSACGARRTIMAQILSPRLVSRRVASSSRRVTSRLRRVLSRSGVAAKQTTLYFFERRQQICEGSDCG